MNCDISFDSQSAVFGSGAPQSSDGMGSAAQSLEVWNPADSSPPLKQKIKCKNESTIIFTEFDAQNLGELTYTDEYATHTTFGTFLKLRTL